MQFKHRGIKKRNKNYSKVNLGLLVMIPLLLFAPSYTNARNIAEKQMLIIGVHDEASFQSVKKELYPIASEEDRKTLWNHDYYPLSERVRLDYKITDIDCIEVKGFSHFIFDVHYDLYNVIYDNRYWHTLPMETTITIRSGKKYDSLNSCSST